jgi:MFS family permease
MIAAITAAMYFLPVVPTYIYVLSFLYGLFAFTLYPLASALANSRVGDDDRVGVSTALLVAFGAGAGLGSTMIAQLMTWAGHQALYGGIAILATTLFILLSQINGRQVKGMSERMAPGDYVVGASDIASSPLAASFDPRIEDRTAQRQLLMKKKK